MRLPSFRTSKAGPWGGSFPSWSWGNLLTANASVAQLSSIEIYYLSFNTQLPAAAPVLDLLLGAGFGGPVLDSFQFNLAENEPDGYKSADFSGNVLTPGLVYTFRFTQAPAFEGAITGIGANVYPGGTLYNSAGASLPNDDLRFHTYGVGETAPVPEPSGGVLLGLGAGLVLVGRYRHAWRPRFLKQPAASFPRAASMLALVLVCSPLLPGDVIRNLNVDGANTLGPGSFGQSVMTPSGGPWNNIRFNFVISESGQIFDANGTGAFGTLFLLSQSYAGTPGALNTATPGLLASTSTINGGAWQFAPAVILQPDTLYFFYMGSVLGPTQVVWANNSNPLADGRSFWSYDGLNYTELANLDRVFTLQGDVAGVPEPGSLTLTAAGLALGWAAVAMTRPLLPARK